VASLKPQIIFFFNAPCSVSVVFCLGWTSSSTSCESRFICAGAMWSIWKAYNDVVFNKKLLSSPKSLIHKMIMLVKTWSPLVEAQNEAYGG